MSAESSRQRALEFGHALREMGAIDVNRFFGGSGLAIGGVQFGFVIKGTLYLRVGDSTRARYEAEGAQPFSYATQGKRVTVASYFEAPAGVLDDPESLRYWAVEAYEVALRA